MWRNNEQKDAVMSAFTEGRHWIVFDTETTGLSNKTDRVIQISSIKLEVRDNELIEIDQLNQYIKQEYPLPAKITEITGITDEILEDKPFEKEVFFNKILPYFGNNPVIVAHNQRFDVGFLKSMYARYGEVFEPTVALDTLEMARDIIPFADVKSYKLGVIAAFYGLDKDLTFHNSMDDVIATTRILRIFVNEYRSRISEKEKTVTEKQKPTVTSIHYWSGQNKFLKRIYVNTNYGVFYWDIYKKIWEKKKDNPIDIETIDMSSLEKQAFAKAGVNNSEDFCKFRD